MIKIDAKKNISTLEGNSIDLVAEICCAVYGLLTSCAKVDPSFAACTLDILMKGVAKVTVDVSKENDCDIRSCLEKLHDEDDDEEEEEEEEDFKATEKEIDEKIEELVEMLGDLPQSVKSKIVKVIREKKEDD